MGHFGPRGDLAMAAVSVYPTSHRRVAASALRPRLARLGARSARAGLIAAVVVLFAIWLASAPPVEPTPGAACVPVARDGDYCPPAPAAGRGGDAPGVVCDSFGRGWRICAAASAPTQ